jgi:3-oxoacyl-[acyl-carrier protein] reductase
MSAIDLGGRVVAVTGGGRGLGMAMAKGLAAAGARVVIASTNPKTFGPVVEQIGSERAVGVAADVTIEADCARVLATALEKFGALDVLVNNARRTTDGHTNVPFWEENPDFFRQSVLTNIHGYFQMARAVAPYMIERGQGKIVNLTSSARTIRRKGNSPYGMTKGTNEVQTLIWAQDLKGTGVTCNALLPGGSCERPGRTGTSKTGGSLLQPEVMAPPVVWLASDQSDGHTGERYVARLWDVSLPADEAARKAMIPIDLNAPADAD